MGVFGGLEAGGTKFVCGIGTGPGDLETMQFPTTTPAETISRAVNWFREKSGGRLRAVGIGSFGPVDLHRDSPKFGYITSTPKEGWKDYDIRGAVRKALGVPVEIDTDVNAAALGEWRWGATQGLSDSLYITVGTGIGGGAIVHDRVLHGMLHPEMGHIRVPRHPDDRYPGYCEFHDDCLEGLACGPAIERRWGVKDARELGPYHRAWAMEAYYLAMALATWVCTLSPSRIVLGGGVMQQPQLFLLLRKNLAQLLKGYVRTPELTSGLGEYVAPPSQKWPGVLGALVLAEQSGENS